MTDNVIHCCIIIQLRNCFCHSWAGMNQFHAQTRAQVSTQSPQTACSFTFFSEEQNGDQSQAAAPSDPHGGNSFSGSTEDYQTANHSATYRPTYLPACHGKHLSDAARSTWPQGTCSYTEVSLVKGVRDIRTSIN